MDEQQIRYHTRIKSLSAKADSDSITLEGKEFSKDERDALIRWAKGKELLTITLKPVQETFDDLTPPLPMDVAKNTNTTEPAKSRRKKKSAIKPT